MTPHEDKYYVLGNVVAGLALLEESKAFSAHIPEVRSNLSMALTNAKRPDDVVGIPGRITSVHGRVRAAGHPALGGSKNTALIILGVQDELPSLRAALEMKYRPETVVVMEGMGLNPQSLEDVIAQTSDPETQAVEANRVFRQAYSENQRVCVPYTSGGHCREGAIIILGETAVQVAKKAIEIAEACESP
jgi:predicted fused transcriptional regulator/phosphomethylpyrimidine kinase